MSSPSSPSSPPSAVSPSSLPPRKRRLWPWLLGVALLGAGAWYASRPAPDAEGGAADSGQRGGPGGPGGPRGPNGRGERPTPVTLAEIKAGDIRVMVPALGTVVPRNQVTVRSRVDGQLLALMFTEGQPVKAGEVLAQIDPEPFKAALEQARGQLARDAALLKNARLDLERYRDLLAQDSIAKQQVDTQEALLRQYQGTVQADEGIVRSAELQLSYTRITAPISGRAGLRTVDPGNMVKASDATGLVTIAQLSPITAVFSLPEERLPAVRQRFGGKGGGGRSLQVEAWDREMKTLLATGELLAVDSQIDPTTGTVKLKATFANQDGSLFPNQFVNVRLLLDTLSGVATVPTAALQQGAKGSYVYRLGADGKVAAVAVKLGPVEGARAAVEAGLAVGEQVVVDGLDKLKDGAAVTPIDPKAVDAPGRERKRGSGGNGGGGGGGRPPR